MEDRQNFGQEGQMKSTLYLEKTICRGYDIRAQSSDTLLADVIATKKTSSVERTIREQRPVV